MIAPFQPKLRHGVVAGKKERDRQVDARRFFGIEGTFRALVRLTALNPRGPDAVYGKWEYKSHGRG
jgi:hypothetical protein